jgi:hypothetical protein
MKSRFPIYFLYSAALVLLVTGTAKLWSITGDAKVLSMIDPIAHLTYRQLMLMVGLLEIVTAIYLFKGRSLLSRATAIFWLSSNFMLYRFAAH